MDMITEKNFQQFIKDIRKKEGWSTQDAARHFNVSPRTIEGWEQGRQPPRPLIPFINYIKGV